VYEYGYGRVSKHGDLCVIVMVLLLLLLMSIAIAEMACVSMRTDTTTSIRCVLSQCYSRNSNGDHMHTHAHTCTHTFEHIHGSKEENKVEEANAARPAAASLALDHAVCRAFQSPLSAHLRR